jgi:NAD(P)-dependent dehydrogenase (short-subunit alcohol dehydrogenase family)
MNKIAFITGGNKGLGKEVAKQLKEHGVDVIIGARDKELGLESARELDVASVQIDVTDEKSVMNAAKEVEERFGRIDILVNNAGITGSFKGKPSEATVPQIQEVYDTNVFGIVRVTNAFIPLLKKSENGRIVNMSSGLGSLTWNSDSDSEFYNYNLITYQTSKTAVNALTVAYAKEMAEFDIKVNAADPGFTATDLNQHRGYQTVEQGASTAVKLALLNQDGETGTYQDKNGVVPW